MSTDQTLARIDATLDDYDTWDGDSPDAARWAGGPDEGEWGDQLAVHEAAMTGCSRVIVGMDPASQHVHFTVVPEIQPFVDAMRRIAEAMIQLVPELNAIKRQAEADTGKSWAYLMQRAQRPHSAAERTHSPRWRAGSRRTKRHARTNPKGTKT